ncbi:MAG: porin [Chitinophagaceae bacterium]|nr:porin [Chitinophagaceae bacterium]
MLRKIMLASSASLTLFCANAQEDSTKSLTISGNADAYYRYNFAGNRTAPNNYTSFTNSTNSFEVGMATLRADFSALSGKVGGTVDIGFGRRIDEFNYNDGESGLGKNGFISLSNLKQAFVTYAPSEKVKFTMGKFGTHVGYELLDAPLNRNYSTSYMFSNGPFFHTGLKADITAGNVGIMVGVANYTDESTSTNSVKTALAQVSGSFADQKLQFYLNYVGFGGSENGVNPGGLKALNQVDLVLLGTITEKFNIGYNGTVQSRKQVDGSFTPDGSWWGSALYFNYDPTSTIGLTWRTEYIGDKKGVAFASENIFANTLSLNYKAGPLTIIPEIRFESAKNEIFLDKDFNGTKSTVSALLAAVISF